MMTEKEYLKEALNQLELYREYRSHLNLNGVLIPHYLSTENLPRISCALNKDTGLLTALELFSSLKAFYSDVIEGKIISEKAVLFDTVDRLHLISALYDGACELFGSK